MTGIFYFSQIGMALASFLKHKACIPNAKNMLKISMTITKNKVVSIDYVLKGPDGEVIDMSGSEPLEYLHGHGNIIPGLEKALEGKDRGDSFKVNVPASEAYGEWDNDIVVNVPRSSFGGVEELEEGMELTAQFPNGSQIVRIIKVTENEVTLDANHPLAGMDLEFEINVREVRDATEEEIACGHVHGEEGSCGGCHGGEECCGSGGCNCGDGCGEDN